MRFFFISPQQKISSLHTGNETDSEFEVFSKRMTFWNIKSNFICFSLHTRSSSCQLGKCTRKLLLILQSHYPNRRSADGRWAKNGKIGRRRPIVGRRRHRFWQIFWSADDFFVEAPKLKVSLTDPPIFIGFVIGEASGDSRPMIGRQSADILNIFHHDIGQGSPDHRASIGRRSPDGRSMTFYQNTVGRQTPYIGRHSADDRSTVGRS